MPLEFPKVTVFERVSVIRHQVQKLWKKVLPEHFSHSIFKAVNIVTPCFQGIFDYGKHKFRRSLMYVPKSQTPPNGMGIN